MCDVIDSLNPVHITGCDRVERRQVAGSGFLLKMFSYRAECRIRTPQAARGTDGDDRTVGNQFTDRFNWDDLGSDHSFNSFVPAWRPSALGLAGYCRGFPLDSAPHDCRIINRGCRITVRIGELRCSIRFNNNSAAVRPSSCGEVSTVVSPGRHCAASGTLLNPTTPNSFPGQTRRVWRASIAPRATTSL